MSRQIPLDRALTDDDRRYLRGLGAHGMHLERRIDENFTPDKDRLAAFELTERKRHAKINGGTGLSANDTANILERNASLEAELEALKAQLAAQQQPDNDAPNYNDKRWTKAALEAEIDRVNGEDADAKLAKGTRDEMIATLTAYFAD